MVKNLRACLWLCAAFALYGCGAPEKASVAPPPTCLSLVDIAYRINVEESAAFEAYSGGAAVFSLRGPDEPPVLIEGFEPIGWSTKDGRLLGIFNGKLASADETGEIANGTVTPGLAFSGLSEVRYKRQVYRLVGQWDDYLAYWKPVSAKYIIVDLVAERIIEVDAPDAPASRLGPMRTVVHKSNDGVFLSIVDDVYNPLLKDAKKIVTVIDTASSTVVTQYEIPGWESYYARPPSPDKQRFGRRADDHLCIYEGPVGGPFQRSFPCSEDVARLITSRDGDIIGYDSFRSPESKLLSASSAEYQSGASNGAISRVISARQKSGLIFEEFSHRRPSRFFRLNANLVREELDWPLCPNAPTSIARSIKAQRDGVQLEGFLHDVVAP